VKPAGRRKVCNLVLGQQGQIRVHRAKEQGLVLQRPDGADGVLGGICPGHNASRNLLAVLAETALQVVAVHGVGALDRQSLGFRAQLDGRHSVEVVGRRGCPQMQEELFHCVGQRVDRVAAMRAVGPHRAGRSIGFPPRRHSYEVVLQRANIF
jgi:hypothetical protein